MSSPEPSDPVADRNLLYGILAVQMTFVSRDALIAAMNAWASIKHRSFGDVLLERGALTPENRQLLDHLVAAHLKAHGGDARRSMAAAGQHTTLADITQSVADPILRDTLETAGNATVATKGAGPPTSGVMRYEVLRPHARGGLGLLSVARDVELGREVALKEILADVADDASSRDRFVREAEVTGGLEHPGIVPVYGLGRYANGRPYYAMRFVRGETLQDAIKKLDAGAPGYTLRALLTRFVAVCNAVAYAHSRGVLHRDLKPANVMLGPFGETLVVDWGLAKVVGRPFETTVVKVAGGTLQVTSGDALATRAGSLLGTPQYMSPEQASGAVDSLGPATDVYSLGATLYCLLTGLPPVQGCDVVDILARVCDGRWSPPRQVKSSVPRALDAICRKAMALCPENRYDSAQALAADVERWVADEPLATYREPWAAQAVRWARRHPRTVSGSAALAGTLVLASAIGLLAVERESRRTADANAALGQSNARLEQTNVTLTSANAALADANAALQAEKRHAFVTALNTRLGAGVTAQKNANVLIWQALGPHPDGVTMPPEYFRWMGIEAPPEQGDYFIGFDRFALDRTKISPDKAAEQLTRVQDRPWTASQCPDVASWLEVNAKPLAFAIQATRRTQYFSPLVPPGAKKLMEASLPTAQPSRPLAAALTARAMLRIGEGDYENAWQDLLACHRLGRLLERGGTLIECLVGIAIDNNASKHDLVFLDRAKLDPQRIKTCLEDLQQLPALPDLADRISMTERLWVLEPYTMLANAWIDDFKKDYLDAFSVGLGSDRPGASAMQFLDSVSLETIDWDEALRTVNAWYDRIAEAMRIKDRGERETELERIEFELKPVRGVTKRREGQAGSLAGDAVANAKVMGRVLAALYAPAVVKIQRGAEKNQQTLANLSVAFALAWYATEQGHYPKDLDELTPRYLPQIPPDLFSGRAIVFHRTESGYLLYSVGPNGKDDGGRGSADHPPGDDISIRMPLPEAGR